MTMPIDLRQVDWLYVAILALFALVANLIANLLFFRRRGVAAVLAAVLLPQLSSSGPIIRTAYHCPPR